MRAAHLGHLGATFSSGWYWRTVRLLPGETRRAAFDLAVTMKELGDSSYPIPEEQADVWIPPGTEANASITASPAPWAVERDMGCGGDLGHRQLCVRAQAR
jgi:hypothetical protein